MSEDIDYLVANRVATMVATVAPGSTTATCSRCEQDVLLSPASRALLAEKPLVVICEVCALQLAGQKPDRAVAVPGAMAELVEMHGPSAIAFADQYLAEWNDFFRHG